MRKAGQREKNIGHPFPAPRFLQCVLVNKLGEDMRNIYIYIYIQSSKVFFLHTPFFQFTGLCSRAICPLPCLFLSCIIVPHWPFEIPIFHLCSLSRIRLLKGRCKHEFIVFAVCPMFGHRIISIYISIGFNSNYMTGFFNT